jgi:hypothetical protein
MSQVLFSSPDDDISILSILHSDVHRLSMSRHILMVQGNDTYKLSSCSVQTHNLISYNPSRFIFPMLQYTSSNNFCWLDGYGVNALSFIVYYHNKCYSCDLMKDVQQSSTLCHYHSQAPLHIWNINCDTYAILSVLWDESHLHRPILLYRTFTIHARKRLVKIHEQTLEIHQVIKIYHGGVKQSNTMYWNVEILHEDFPIRLSKTPCILSSNHQHPHPPVRIYVPSSKHIYLHMMGAHGKYVEVDEYLHASVYHHPCKIFPLMKTIIEKWKWMTYRPPKMLHTDDPGGYGYQKYRDLFYQHVEYSDENTFGYFPLINDV